MNDGHYNSGIIAGLFEAKHWHAIGEAVWLFGWLIHRQNKSTGEVLSCMPLKDDSVSLETGHPVSRIRRWRKVLVESGYISITRTPCGNSYVILRPKKFANRKTATRTKRLSAAEVSKLALDGGQRITTSTLVRNLRAMPYGEYLLTEHWRNIRMVKIAGAGSRCELCFSRESLNVHHKTYERRGCEHLNDLIVLCETCHATFHGKAVHA